MKKPRKLSLRLKLIMIGIFSLVIPSIGIINVSNYLTKVELKEQTLENMEGSVELVYYFADNIVSDMIHLANTIQFDSKINYNLKDMAYIKMTENSDTNIELQKWTLNKEINNLLNLVSNKEMYYITIILPGNEMYTNYSTREFNPSMLLDDQLYSKLNELKALETKWVGVHRSESDEDEHYLTIARTLRGSYPEPYAYLLISIAEEKLSDFFRNYNENQDIMIIDNENKILSHSEPNMIGEKFDVTVQSKQLSLNQDDIIVSEDLSFGGWKLVSLSSSKQLLATINNLYRNLNLIHLGFILLFILILIYSINKLTKSISKLSHVAEKVNEGDLSVRSEITGNDEIGTLGQSFDNMLDEINDMIKQIKHKEDQKKIFEIDMLVAQLHPHFLFNILNSIRMKILLNNDTENAKLISSLSSFLRMSLKRDDDFMTICEELAVIDHYMELINLRSKDKITLQTAIEQKVLSYKIPRFTLQPLVENAIFHGLHQKEGTIKISAWTRDNLLYITIQDDGEGINEKTLTEINKIIEGDQENYTISGIGIRNLIQRFNIYYEVKPKVEFKTLKNGGTKITFKLPIIEDNKNENTKSDR